MNNPAPGFTKHPGHTLKFEPCKARARCGDLVVAESTEAVLLHEGHYPPVVYFPPGARTAGHFRKTDHTTYCPFKGHASYWSLIGTSLDQKQATNAVWGYEDPYDECEKIRSFIAFYGDRVTVEQT